MGSYVLRGISTALLVTVVTLFAGIFGRAMGLGGLSVSQLLDIGLLASCLIGGYRTAKESKEWFMGGVTGAGYVIVGTLLLALFLPIRGLGFIQVLIEGTLIGLVAGAFGAGKRDVVPSGWTGRPSRSAYTPSYVGYDRDDQFSSNFKWDSEEDITPRANPSKLQWINSSEDEFEGVREIQKDSEESSVIKWPWDRENECKTISRKEDPVPMQNDLVVWDKSEEKAKPWWEQ
ncbi:hypothetical protein [Desulfosporosinus sp.]|uniref:hypothetical protein n=1 Tax=Desulfosporosinus sp. TaxID=157907 RepID=UPI0025C6940C|nr:hypothetical protein [Desulfosporosinus sp.]MBC2721325.1 TIGR04086 family membrane protein [Desulfosporosinus sp.]MBC2728821.1 TIGR04086 family membrane protein [Desulfosporosinus sp.]